MTFNENIQFHFLKIPKNYSPGVPLDFKNLVLKNVEKSKKDEK